MRRQRSSARNTPDYYVGRPANGSGEVAARSSNHVPVLWETTTGCAYSRPEMPKLWRRRPTANEACLGRAVETLTVHRASYKPPPTPDRTEVRVLNKPREISHRFHWPTQNIRLTRCLGTQTG